MLRAARLLVLVLSLLVVCVPHSYARQPLPPITLDASWYVVEQEYHYDESRRFERGWNRGVDVRAPRGVRALLSGRVRFVGTVAGRRVVTIVAKHAEREVVTTFSGLDAAAVREGNHVQRGDRIGEAKRLHVGAYDAARRSSYVPIRLGAAAVGQRTAPAGDRSLSGAIAGRLHDAINGAGDAVRPAWSAAVHATGAVAPLPRIGSPRTPVLVRVLDVAIDDRSLRDPAVGRRRDVASMRQVRSTNAAAPRTVLAPRASSTDDGSRVNDGISTALVGWCATRCMSTVLQSGADRASRRHTGSTARAAREFSAGGPGPNVSPEASVTLAPVRRGAPRVARVGRHAAATASTSSIVVGRRSSESAHDTVFDDEAPPGWRIAIPVALLAAMLVWALLIRRRRPRPRVVLTDHVPMPRAAAFLPLVPQRPALVPPAIVPKVGPVPQPALAVHDDHAEWASSLALDDPPPTRAPA